MSHTRHQACVLRCCVRMSQGVFILRGRLLQRIVSFVMQFSILCCSGLRMRGERRNRVRDRASISYGIPWKRVDPYPHLLLRQFASWQQLVLVIIVEITLK